MATLAPASANASARVRPMRLAAPVTSATLPCKLSIDFILPVYQGCLFVCGGVHPQHAKTCKQTLNPCKLQPIQCRDHLTNCSRPYYAFPAVPHSLYCHGR